LRTLAAAIAALLIAGCAGPVIVMPWAERAPEANVIYFDHDAYKVDDTYRALLEAHARRMREHPALRLRLDATADAQGPLDYNRALAKKRAEMVMRELVGLGVPAQRIDIASFGEVRHGARRSAHESSANDRRVELTYR
jgi:peptidoglycan-associated lipoprotein